MAIDLGGISFSINVSAGNSAKNARSVAAALAEVNREMQRAIKLGAKLDLDGPTSGSSKSSRGSRSAGRGKDYGKETVSAVNANTKAVQTQTSQLRSIHRSLNALNEILKRRPPEPRGPRQQRTSPATGSRARAEPSAGLILATQRQTVNSMNALRAALIGLTRPLLGVTARGVAGRIGTTAFTNLGPPAQRRIGTTAFTNLGPPDPRRIEDQRRGLSTRFAQVGMIAATADMMAKAFAQRFVQELERSMRTPRLTNRRAAGPPTTALSYTPLAPGEFRFNPQRRLGTTAGVNMGPPETPRLEDRRRGLSVISKDAANANQSVRSLGMGLDSVLGTVTALAGAFGSLRLVSFIKDATLLAGRVENLDTVLRNTASTANFSRGQVTQYEDSIKALGITTQSARTIMTRFAQNQLELSDAARIARIAQDAAVVAGINSSQATERLAVAVQRLDTRMLRNLGILVNLRQEYQKVGLETGRVETSLTAAEKQQIVLNAVVRQGAALAGNYEAALGDVFKRYTSLDRKVEESTKVIGEQFLPAFGIAVDLVDAFLDRQMEASQTMLFFQSVGLSTAVTFVGLGSVVALASSAVIAYNRVVLGMTLANAQAAISVRGLTAAMGLFAASPIGKAVLAITAVVGALTALSSLTQAARRRREESIREIEKEVSATQSVNELSADIERLAAVQNRDAFEESRLLSNMQSIAALAGESKDALLGAMGDIERFQELTATAFPNVGQTIEQQLQAIKPQVADLRREMENIDGLLKMTGPSSLNPAGVPLNPFSAAYDTNLRNRRQNIQDDPTMVRNEALTDERIARDLRRFDKMDQLADTAQQLVLRVQNRISDTRLDQAGDSILQDMKSLQSMQKNLSVSYETIEDITQRHKLKLESIDRESARKRTEIQRQFASDSAQRERSLTELDAGRLTQIAAANEKLRGDLDRRKETLQGFDQIREATQNIITDRSAEIARQQEAISMMSQGMSSEAVSAIQAFAAGNLESARAAEIHQERIVALEDELGRLDQALLTASDSQEELLQRQKAQVQEALELQKSMRQIDMLSKSVKRSAGIQEEISQVTQELEDLEYQAELTASGLEDDVVRSMIDVRNIMREGEQEAQILQSQYDTLATEVDTLRESLVGAEGAQKEFIESQIAEITITQAQLLSLQQLRAELTALKAEAAAVDAATSSAEMEADIRAAADIRREVDSIRGQIKLVQREASMVSSGVSNENIRRITEIRRLDQNANNQAAADQARVNQLLSEGKVLAAAAAQEMAAVNQQLSRMEIELAVAEQIREMAEELRGLAAAGRDAAFELGSLQVAGAFEDADTSGFLNNIRSITHEGGKAVADMRNEISQLQIDLAAASAEGLGHIASGIKKQIAELQNQMGVAIESTTQQLANAIQDFVSQTTQSIKDFEHSQFSSFVGTEQFIANQSGDTGRAQALGRAQEFLGAAGQVTNEGQLNRIISVYQQMGPAFTGVIEEIRRLGTERLEAIRQERETLERQKEIADNIRAHTGIMHNQLSEAAKANQILSQILNTLSGGRGATGTTSSRRTRWIDGELNGSGGRSMLRNSRPYTGANIRQNSGGGMFPSNFDPSRFSGSVQRFAEANNDSSNSLVSNLQGISQVFEDQVNLLVETNTKVNGIAHGMKQKNENAKRALSGAGL